MVASVEDRFAISDLFVRYANALDTGDVEAIVACFTEDGSMESPVTGTHTGHDEIRTFSQRFAVLPDKGVQLRHSVSNFTMDVDGENGRAGCYLMSIVTINGESQLMPPGRYQCEIRKVNGTWLFQSRLVELDAPFSLPGS
jgi:uncharacterized protein (TIGR02246 family)